MTIWAKLLGKFARGIFLLHECVPDEDHRQDSAKSDMHLISVPPKQRSTPSICIPNPMPLQVEEAKAADKESGTLPSAEWHNFGLFGAKYSLSTTDPSLCPFQSHSVPLSPFQSLWHGG